jgi:diacylglycerol kinase family enzyme
MRDGARATEARPAPTRPHLIVNLRSGDGKAESVGLLDAARRRDIAVHVLEPEVDLQELARDAVDDGADALGMAGGDGSLGLVAEVAMDAGLPFVCVPAGTRNHFARDIGLDRDRVVAGLDAFVGERRRVDAAKVNDRVFLNNVTLGVYAEIVHEPGYRENKLGTAGEVLPEMLTGGRDPVPIRFSDPEGHRWDSAFMVLVANNPYDLVNITEFGVRARLDLGQLAVTVIDASAAGEFADVAASALLGRLEQSSSFHHWRATHLDIDSADPELLVGLDGEALSFTAPLHFEVLPGALEVLVPRGTRGPLGYKRKVFGRRTFVELWDVAAGRQEV